MKQVHLTQHLCSPLHYTFAKQTHSLKNSKEIIYTSIIIGIFTAGIGGVIYLYAHTYSLKNREIKHLQQRQQQSKPLVTPVPVNVPKTALSNPIATFTQGQPLSINNITAKYPTTTQTRPSILPASTQSPMAAPTIFNPQPSTSSSTKEKIDVQIQSLLKNIELEKIAKEKKQADDQKLAETKKKQDEQRNLEEQRKLVEQQKLTQQRILEQIRHAEENKTDTKVIAVALKHIDNMCAYYYTDGKLNNQYGINQIKSRFEWNRKELLTKVEKLDAKGDHDEADKIKLRVQKIERSYQKTLTALPPYLFPLQIDSKEYELTDIVVDADMNLIVNHDFFHGTTNAAAQEICMNGFHEQPLTRRILDTGFGAYLALNEKDALQYAKKDPAGVVKVQLKTSNTMDNSNNENDTKNEHVKYVTKIALYHHGLHHLVQDIFHRMSRDYISNHIESVVADFTTDGVALNDKMQKFEYINQLLPMQLTNLFTRAFFENMGYQGVYAHHSALAGCGYLNIFRPSQYIDNTSPTA